MSDSPPRAADDATGPGAELDLRAIFPALPGTWVVLAPDAPRFTMLAVSEDYARSVMRSPAELVGGGLFETLPDASPANPHPTGERNVRASLATVLRTREPHRMDVQRYDARRPDGTWEEYHWEPLNTPVPGPDGRVRYVLHQVANVTARIRAERAAATARHQLRMAFMQAPALVAVTEGPEHRFVLANSGFEQILGRGDLTGRTVHEALPEMEAQGIPARLDRVYATGEPYVASEQRIELRRDGAPPYEGWYNFVYQPLVDAEGRVTGILQHVVEVTAHVRARMEVEEARRIAETRAATLDAILQSIPDALYVGTADGITMANPQALEQLGFGSLDELNRGVPTLAEEIRTRDPATGRRLAVEEEPFLVALTRGRTAARDVLVRHRMSGEDRVVRCSAAPVLVDGAVVGAVAVNTDVTDVRQAAAEREQLLADSQAARGEAERANRAKSEFLAVMSHELRTPLNAIAGYAEILEMGIHGPVTDAQRSALGRIQLSQQHLLGLINDVLNYAKLETGSVRYDLRCVPVRDVVATVEALMEPQLRAHAFTPGGAHCAPELAVWADAEKLRQILLNLISNAVKFTDPGGHVELAFRAEGTHLHLSVRDTGIGIAADQREAIFEPFVQVRSDLTRTAEGTGLGLAISRDLARGMGGDLRVESTPGKGSTFTLTLPVCYA